MPQDVATDRYDTFDPAFMDTVRSDPGSGGMFMSEVNLLPHLH